MGIETEIIGASMGKGEMIDAIVMRGEAYKLYIYVTHGEI